MERISTIWLQLVLAAVFFETGSCIRCYLCTSHTEPRCGDPMYYYDLQMIDCNRNVMSDTYDLVNKVLGYPYYNPNWNAQYNEFHCAKLTSHNQRVSNYNKTVVRGCLPARYERYDPCREITGNSPSGSVIATCDTCYTEGCNGSNKITNALTAILLPLIAMIVARQ